MKIRPENITAVVLAGGRGRRFEGRDKGLIDFKQCPIIEHVIGAIAPQVSGIMINANRSEKIYAEYGYPVIGDELTGYQGPLAGFATAMKRAITPYILVLPCDGPYVSTDFAARMAHALEVEEADIAVAHDGERLQPVHALIRVDLLPSLNRFLESGERKIDRWYALHRIARADFSDSPTIFKNINTIEELKVLEG